MTDSNEKLEAENEQRSERNPNYPRDKTGNEDLKNGEREAEK